MQALIDPAVTALAEMIQQTDDLSVRMRASADLLDRVGFKPTDKLKLSGDADEPLEIVISRPRSDVPQAASDGTS